MATDSPMERLVDEVVAIKKLMICAMRKDGVTQEQIAAALGIRQSSVSRMLSDGGGPKRPSGAKRKVKEGTNA